MAASTVGATTMIGVAAAVQDVVAAVLWLELVELAAHPGPEVFVVDWSRMMVV